MTKHMNIIPIDRIENRILLVRGERVIIDADLARFYGVPTRRLNEQVKRNHERFPADFMFQLRPEEKKEVIAICDHLANLKYSPTLPFVFTEHGAIMAANVLSSARAVSMGVLVVRAFVNLRRHIVSQQDFARQLAQLERRIGGHDQQMASIVAALKSLLNTDDVPRKRRIGFANEDS